MAEPKTTLTFKYLLISGNLDGGISGVHQESNDVESILETARVMLHNNLDVTITIRREE
jgi:hypothetical protein